MAELESDIPPSYRLKGRSDFLKFVKKMVCNVNERLSAKELLVEEPGKTWLRILPANDERKLNKSNIVRGDKKRRKVFVTQKSSDQTPTLSSSSKPSSSATETKATKDVLFQADADDEEFCQFLVEHDQTVASARKHNTERLKEGEQKKLCFIEEALKLVPTSEVELLPLSKSAQKNTPLGYSIKQVKYISNLLQKYLDINKLKYEAIVEKSKNIKVEDIRIYFTKCWNPFVLETNLSKRLKDKDEKEVNDLINIMVGTC
jgi:hypothetical protein